MWTLLLFPALLLPLAAGAEADAGVILEPVDPIKPEPYPPYPYYYPTCVCHLPKKVGPCEALIQRWYYDQEKEECVQFNYGGCEGNGNNFASKYACEQRCLCPVQRYYYPLMYPIDPIKLCPYPQCGEGFKPCSGICCYNYYCGKNVCTPRPS